MTVSAETNKVTYSGDDSTTVFASTFEIFDDDDILVQIVDSSGTVTTKTKTTHYTVGTITSPKSTVNITMLTAPATGETLVLRRNQPQTQSTDYVENDNFPAQTHENNLDKLTFQVQEHEERLDRTLRLNPSQSLSTYVPSLSGNAGKVLAVNTGETGYTYTSVATASLDINSLDAATIAGADTIPFYDDSAAANKKTTLTNLEGVLNHDNLAGFVANEHIDWTGTPDADFSSQGTMAVAGDADSVQLLITGHSTQTNDLVQFKSNAGTTQFAVDNSGNVTVNGTVDGRDLATDGTKLDGIEAGATQVTTARVDAALGTSNGIITRTANDTYTNRSVAGTSNEVDVTNGDGVSGNPTVGLSNTVIIPGSLEIPNGTSPTTDTAGEIAINTDGDGSSVTHGVLDSHDGTNNLTFFPTKGTYPTTDNDVMAYDSATNSITWQQPVGAGSITQVSDDASPSLGGQLDVNGFALGDGTRELLDFVEDPLAVNHLEIENNETGNDPVLRSTGDDANVGMLIDTKGTGTLALGSADSVITMTATSISGSAIKDEDNMSSDSATHLATQQSIKAYADTKLANVVEDTTPQLGGQLDVNGNAIGDGTRELLTFTEDASAVNHVNIENEATGSGPIISAAGDDTNIDLNINAKGTGNIAVGNYTFDADQTVGAGQDNYVLTYDNGTGLVSLETAPGGASAATQAEQEAATSTSVYVSPGRQHYHPGSAKAWVKYTTVTTTAIDTSYNVSSLTDLGTGSTTVNWDTDFSSADYCCACVTGNSSVDYNVDTYAVGSVRYRTYNTSIVLVDIDDVCIVAFGDH